MSGFEHWLAGVPAWTVYLVAFGFVCAESAIFAGFVVPGETVLLLGGVLAGLGHVKVVVLAVCGVAGAIIGDSIGFEVGRVLGPRLRGSRLGSLVKESHWRRAESFLARYGGRSVFLGRWVSFGRALVPALAGAARMRYRTFLLWNALGGLTWAAVVVAVGYLAGGSWQQVEKIFGRASLLVGLTIVGVAVVVAAARWVARHPDQVRGWVRRQADRPRVRALRERYDRELSWLARRLRPRSALGLELSLGLVAVVATGWLFGAIVQDVIAGEEAARLDAPVLRWLVDHRHPTLTRIVLDIHATTGATVALVGAVVLGGLIAWRCRAAFALLLPTGAWVGAGLTSAAVNLMAHRAPPPATLVVPGVAVQHGSFPSIDVATTTAVVVVLVALIAARTATWGRAVATWTAGLVLVGMAGVSAAYLGSGWTTDVFGGWALGAAWDAVLLTAWTTWRRLRVGNATDEAHAHPVDAR